jgi:nitroreductase
MNEVLKTITRRRSVRRFRAEQLTRHDLDAIVAAGLCAPSANNAQDWYFTVVQNGAMCAKINRWILDEIESSGNAGLQELVMRGGGTIFRNAPTLIIVSTKKSNQSGIINAAAATENMLIAAESLGIASCWIGMISMLAGSKLADTYAKELHLPDGYMPQNGVTLGYRESPHPPDPPPRRQNLVSYFV